MTTKVDLTGQVFGRLTVLRQGDDYVSPSGWRTARWVCTCACGTETLVQGKHLRSGQTVSCGCVGKERLRAMGRAQQGTTKPPKYEPGTKWGQMTLLENLPTNGKDRRGIFECDCGNIVDRQINNIRRGVTTNCAVREFHPDPRWVDKPSYGSAHRRVYTVRGKASEHACVSCGATGSAVQWAYVDGDLDFLADTEGPNAGLHYGLDPYAYVPLCRSCHGRADTRHSARMNGSELIDLDRHVIGHMLSQAYRLEVGLPAVSPTDPTWFTDE